MAISKARLTPCRENDGKKSSGKTQACELARLILRVGSLARGCG
jgi:hypothetical protein